MRPQCRHQARTSLAERSSTKRGKPSSRQLATAGKTFLARRDRIEAFVTRMGEELNQDAVSVLAFDSDSFLIELEEGGS